MTQVQKNNIQDLDDIAAQVEELIGELSEACEQVSKRLSDDSSEEDDAAPEDQAEGAEPEAAAEAADAITDEAQQASGEDQEASADREPHPAEEAIDELEQQLGDLIEAGAQAEAEESEDAVPKGTAPESDSGAPTVSAIDAEDIDDLDQQIAELTDELLDGDFTDADGDPVAEATAPATPKRRATDKATEPQQPEPEAEVASASADDEAEQNETARAAAETENESKAEAVRPTPKPSPAPRATPRAEPGPEKGSHPVVVVLFSVLSKADAGARTLADLLATPLKNRPKIVRDTVGWFGLWTLFLAVCVWLTLAFFRSPEHPEAEGEPMRIRSAEESSAPPTNQRPLPHPEAVRSTAPHR